MIYRNEIKQHLKMKHIPTFTLRKDIPFAHLKKELLSSKYSLSSLKTYIENVNTYYEIQLFNIKIHLIYHHSQFIPKLLLSRIIRRLYIISKLFNIHKDITYWFLPNEHNRSFPAKDTIVTPESINGGYTYPKENDIYIYRYEDFSKVMIHELLHHSIIELNTTWTDDQINNLKYYFNISKSCNLLPNEALVEVWATYFHLQFISLEYNIPFKNLYALECRWGLQQTYRLLTLKKDDIWFEKTNSFTYIVFKTIFLIHLHKFLKMKLPYNAIDIYNFILNNRNLRLEKNKNKSMRISLLGNL